MLIEFKNSADGKRVSFAAQHVTRVVEFQTNSTRIFVHGEATMNGYLVIGSYEDIIKALNES